MISKSKFWLVSAALALVGLAGSSWVTTQFVTPNTPHSDAAWAFTADSVKALAQHADAIVVAKAVASHPGRVAVSANGSDLLPFQIVEFRVTTMLKGDFPDGRVYVERAGGVEPGTSVHHEIDVDGGEFEDGATYLLFLNEQPGNTGLHYQVNDQARYSVVRGRLQSVRDEADDVTQVFHRRGLTEAELLIRQVLE